MSVERQIAVKPLAGAGRSVAVLQRKCACGGSAGHEGECEECRKKATLQRRTARGGRTPATAPPIVHDVLRSPGQPLDAPTRAFMEPRFGHDFGKVRVHADARAAESARAVNALAYTVGHDVVFGAGQYSGTTKAGRELLAHELVHVMQQGSAPVPARLTIGSAHCPAEAEADSLGNAIAAPGAQRPKPLHRALLQRKLVVNPNDSIPLPAGATGRATPLTAAIQGLLGDTCPDGHFQVDTTTGNVTPEHAQFCEEPRPPWLSAAVSSTPVGCGCVCDTINNAKTATIEFHPGGPNTSPGSVAGAGPGQGGVATDSTVNADPRFQGQYKINGNWVDIPFYLIFSHELCGHALPKMLGTHVARGAGAAGGTPPQEQHAVDVERQIAAEHNPPLPRRPDDYAGAARQKP